MFLRIRTNVPIQSFSIAFSRCCAAYPESVTILPKRWIRFAASTLSVWPRSSGIVFLEQERVADRPSMQIHRHTPLFRRHGASRFAWKRPATPRHTVSSPLPGSPALLDNARPPSSNARGLPHPIVPLPEAAFPHLPGPKKRSPQDGGETVAWALAR